MYIVYSLESLYKTHPCSAAKVATTDGILYKVVYLVRKVVMKPIIPAFREGVVSLEGGLCIEVAL